MVVGRGRSIAHFAIMSRRPGKEWGTRNDRFEDAGSALNFEARYARLLTKVEMEIMRWQIVEPRTEFRIEDRSM